MSAITPNYGDLTVIRPMRANVPEGAPGWVLTACPYCGGECWKTALEPDPLPTGVTAACTACAFRRHHHQREMDAARAAREAARN